MDHSDDDFDCCEGDDMLNYSYLCFICETNFNEVETMLEHVSHSHNIDIKRILKSANITNQCDWIKIVNYVRKNKSNLSNENVVNGAWKSDEYLKPHIEDDNLLFTDYEIFIDCDANETSENHVTKIAELENKVSVYEDTIMLLRKKVTELLDFDGKDEDETKLAAPTCDSKASKLTEEDNAYFTGYSHYSIHDIMIKDKVRTESYRKFIEDNGAAYFKDKVVLDVGCGTGILSMFAARSGAAHVYGVDCADIIYDAMAIVEKNGLKDKITLVHGKLEEVSLPCDKVDVVISEWMGYFLIYESMLDSVLFACRRYLNPESGRVFPRYFTLNIVGADMTPYKTKNIDCWDSVFGLDMSCMKMNVMKEVLIDVVPNDDVLTAPCLIRDYDVQKMAFDSNSACPQVIEQSFELTVTKTGKLGAIVAYFDTFFLLPNESEEEQVMFSTGPAATSTHWQQTVLILNEEISVVEGETVRGSLNVCRHTHGKRGLNFSLKIADKHNQNYEFS